MRALVFAFVVVPVRFGGRTLRQRRQLNLEAKRRRREQTRFNGLMHSLRCGATVALLLLAGCPPRRLDVQCAADSDCNLDGQVGLCLLASSGNQWCAYEDRDCPSGYRYSDFDVEDAFSDVCVASHKLTVELSGTAKETGVVTSEPAGLTCSAGICTKDFVAGASVLLSASNPFLGWSDGCRGNGTCSVVMDRDQTVGAWFGVSGEALWALRLGGTDSDFGDRGAHITIDEQGDLIAVGGFRQTITPTDMPLTSAGAIDIYVIKLSRSNGAVVWARRLGGIDNDLVDALAVDRLNNIYLAGTFSNIVDFGNGPQSAVGERDMFVLKLDSNGSFVWLKTASTTGFIFPAALAVDGNSAVIAGTYASGTMTFGATTLASANSGDGFVFYLDASQGTTRWNKSISTSISNAGSVNVRQAAIDHAGNIVLVGAFSGTLVLGPDSLFAQGNDGFISKLSPDGVPMWTARFGGIDNDGGHSIAIDSSDDIIATGLAGKDAGFGCANHTITGPSGFIARFTRAGACRWVKSFSGQGTQSVAGVTVNEPGEIAIVGSFCGSIVFDTQALGSTNDCPFSDVFAARFTGDGSLLHAVRTGGTSHDIGNGIAQTTDGRMFVTGEFRGFAEFGGKALTAEGSADAFVVGLAPF